MLQFTALKEMIEEDMLKICKSEIELAHDDAQTHQSSQTNCLLLAVFIDHPDGWQ